VLVSVGLVDFVRKVNFIVSFFFFSISAAVSAHLLCLILLGLSLVSKYWKSPASITSTRFTAKNRIFWVFSCFFLNLSFIVGSSPRLSTIFFEPHSL